MRKLLGWERYDTHEAVEARHALYGQELRLWLNLFLPSVKLLKKVRIGSKVRRVYDGPRTPFERVRACPEGGSGAGRAARTDEEATRPVSAGQDHRPQAGANLPAGQSATESRNQYRKTCPGNARCGERAVEKTSLRSGTWKSKTDFHFPTATATTALRLHRKSLDEHLLSYVLKWLDRDVAALAPHSESRTGGCLGHRNLDF